MDAEVAAALGKAVEFAFVMSKRQNAFFFEVVAAIRSELTRLGVKSTVSTEGFLAPHWRRVFVLFPPHEYSALEAFEPGHHPDLMGRTILVCAEQPESPWFEGNVKHAYLAGAVFDINRRAVDGFAERGIQARHFRLGYTPVWDRMALPGDPDAGRPTDVVFLGSASTRRLRQLARCARVLWHRGTELIISDNSRPNTAPAPNFVVGESKLDLLRRSRLLLNIHRDDEPYFEWLRAVEAIHCGAVIVTESSTDYAPLVPGRHLLIARADALPDVLEAALGDDTRLARIRRAAYELLRTFPLAESVRDLVAVGAELTYKRVPSGPIRVTASPAAAFVPAPFAPAAVSQSLDAGVVRQVLKEVRLDLLDVRRQLQRLTHLAAGTHVRPLRVVAVSAAYRAMRRPRVSIITALFNHAGHVQGALESVRRSRFDQLEVVVVDDGSTDGSGDRVREFMRAEPRLPVLLLRHDVNRGLGDARNSGLAFARSELAFVLDADNRLYPTGVTSLLNALDGDHEAAFAYGMLECVGPNGPSQLVSYLPWEPERLRAGNYIDAMAMLRVQVVRQLGGYTTDRRLYGWEDYDLWCSLAENGYRGVLVPAIVARYQVSPTSMLALTNISRFAAFAALVERHPALMGGITPPL